jgi:hypothetical protein
VLPLGAVGMFAGRVAGHSDAMSLVGRRWPAGAKRARSGEDLQRLECPRCGITVMLPAHGRDEFCPRCLARTRGALSVTLTPCEAGRGHDAEGLLGRLRRPVRR